ncbi:hypothetical protein NliqN6_1526 [Naganishia liquefaciens]|uniref:Uncharacterized protein n=1 Tax=Naganishia liquefaciens TaxID=104408 RepID=A0A8H3TQJ3_9TREE|nr:hypothetical protein NliqN6_1526 [Naganishia liquefaciens]
MSFLDQAKAAANSAINTATNLTNQATAAAQPALQNVAASVQPTLQNMATSVQPALNTVAQGATAAATQAQAGLHSAMPSVVPAPTGTSSAMSSGGVDTSHDLNPHSSGTAALDSFLSHRPDPAELQEKNILKGAPNDSLAGKKADLMKAQLGTKLDEHLQHRPQPEELVQEGILTPGEAPPAK